MEKSTVHSRRSTDETLLGTNLNRWFLFNMTLEHKIMPAHLHDPYRMSNVPLRSVFPYLLAMSFIRKIPYLFKNTVHSGSGAKFWPGEKVNGESSIVNRSFLFLPVLSVSGQPKKQPPENRELVHILLLTREIENYDLFIKGRRFAQVFI